MVSGFLEEREGPEIEVVVEADEVGWTPAHGFPSPSQGRSRGAIDRLVPLPQRPANGSRWQSEIMRRAQRSGSAVTDPRAREQVHEEAVAEQPAEPSEIVAAVTQLPEPPAPTRKRRKPGPRPQFQPESLPAPPEGSQLIPGYPGYAVTKDGGAVYSGRQGAQWRPRRLGYDPTGHRVVTLVAANRQNKSGSVAHFVLLTYSGPPPDDGEAYVVRRHDDDPTNDHIDNLYWGLKRDFARENRLNFLSGRSFGMPRGEHHAHAKLSEQDVVAIRERVAAGALPGRLAPQYGVTAANILHIVKRETWRHVPPTHREVRLLRLQQRLNRIAYPPATTATTEGDEHAPDA